MEITFDKLPIAVSELGKRLQTIEELLRKLDCKHLNEDDTILTIQQAAELLNLKVPTIYGLVSRSAIPNSKKGKRLYFSKNDLLHWIQSGKNKTHEELEKDAEAVLARKK